MNKVLVFSFFCWCLAGSLPAQKLDTLPVTSIFTVSNKLPYHFRDESDAVLDKDSLKSNPPTNIKQASWDAVWLKFTVKRSGTLSFIVIPDYAEDDIDFTLYQERKKHKFLGKYKAVRDMQAGDQPNVLNSPCMGPTGLRAGEYDIEANGGCADQGDNNWLRPLHVQAGEQFFLLVNNTTAFGHGFVIRFSGDMELTLDF
jgi:hypothetical protein